MKTKIITLVCLALSSFLFAQNNDFNNGGGDFLWSNTANWSLGSVPTSFNIVRLPVLAESQVDADYTITKIQTIFTTANANPGSTVPIAGTSTLTLNPNQANFAAIENVSNHDAILSFKGNVEINNPAGSTNMKNANGAANSIVFADGSTLTLTTDLTTANGSNNAGFQFNGTLAGSGNLRFGDNTTTTFGSTSSNGGYLGELPFLGNSAVIVNTADNAIFYNGPKLQINGNNSSIEINGENVFASGITVGGSNIFTFKANKDQNNMKTIGFSVDGTINLVIDPSVDYLTFADNSPSASTPAWNSGTLNITGFSEEKFIRFGTDNTGLTASQLTQITVDNGVEYLALDSDGFLVDLGSLNHEFNNDGGDFLWSNTDNWSLGSVPTSSFTVRLPILEESQVDADYTIKKIQTIFSTANANPGSPVPIAGTSTLTLNPNEANFAAIENVSNYDAILSFKGNVEINNPAGFTNMKNANGAANSIAFADGSTLTLTTNLTTANGSNNAGFQFNGTLAGSGNLRFGDNTTTTFGSTSSNGGYLGELPFLGNSAVIVNTADNAIFYNGPKLQINGNNASIEINGENVFASGITVGGSNTFTFTANENQNSMSSIIFSNNGSLNLVIADSITDLSFADNSSSIWNSGSLVITGFKEGVIRFGTDNMGLTAGQLTQITADNGGKPLELDDNGYLVNVPDFRYSSGTWSPNHPITGATPSIVTDNIFVRDGSAEITGRLSASSLRIATGATLNLISTGILDLDRNIFNSGSLVFQSDEDGSGQIDEFSGTITGSGNVKVERYIPASNRAFRYISSSVNTIGSIKENLQEGANNTTTTTNSNPSPSYGTHITGSASGDNGFDATETGSPSMFEFNEPTQDWIAVTNTNSKNMNVGEAYALLIRGDRSTNLATNTPVVTPTTLRFTGSLHTGEYQVPSTNLSSTIDHYNLVANPYQAIVDTKTLLQNDAADLDQNYIYIYDPTLGTRGGYATVNLSEDDPTSTPTDTSITGTSSADENLMPNQAFFVKTIGASPALNFKENHKKTTANFVTTFSNDNGLAQLNINLKRQAEDILVDGVSLRFNTTYSNAVDDADASKFWNFDEWVALLNADQYLSIEKRAIPEDGDEIQIYSGNYKTDTYVWEINMSNMNHEAVLYDNYTAIETPLNLNELNQISFTVDTAIPESVYSLRFSIRFKEETFSVNEELKSKLVIYPNPVTQNRFSIKGLPTLDVVHIKVFDMSGRLVYTTKELVENDVRVNIQQFLPAGVYQLKIEQNQAVFFAKLMI